MSTIAAPVDPGVFRAAYDREPIGFSHDLHTSGLFDLSALGALARRCSVDDFYVAGSARAPGTRFYDVAAGGVSPGDAIANIGNGAYRVILKRPERYDVRFRLLLEQVATSISSICNVSSEERIVRLDGAILVNSAEAITPLHFDPEISFFFQIAGAKRYHLFDPRKVAEDELERFYVKGKLDIGQVEFARRAGSREFVFELKPGMGIHQPQNTPHWVYTHDQYSISYVVSFETERGQALGRTRGFNYVERRLGFRPALPGTLPHLDALKSQTMAAAFALKRRIVAAVHAVRHS